VRLPSPIIFEFYKIYFLIKCPKKFREINYLISLKNIFYTIVKKTRIATKALELVYKSH